MHVIHARLKQTCLILTSAAALAVAPRASAGIISENIGASSSDFLVFNLDSTLTDSNWDSGYEYYFSTSSYHSVADDNGTSKIAMDGPGSGIAANLTVGTVIGATIGANNDPWGESIQFNQGGDPWPQGSATSGYLGLRIGDSGSYEYGWANVSLDANGIVTLNSLAYDNTGAPITVGAVPEPGTWALAGVGALCLMMAARRRTMAKA